MKNNVYGYVRVSTKEQNEARQVIAMHEFGVDEQNVFIEKQSGKDFNRPKYKRLLRKLKAGDTLVIKSIDRLGRNYDEIIDQWRIITKEKQAAIVVLDMPLLDTRQGRDLTGTLIADIVLQLLSYVAQTEREFIKRRQAEGIAAAKARGVQFGARPKLKPAEFGIVLMAWQQGMLSAREAGKRVGVSHTTFLRWARETNETSAHGVTEILNCKNVGLSMILDSERGKPFSGRKPSERAHGTGVGATFVCS